MNAKIGEGMMRTWIFTLSQNILLRIVNAKEKTVTLH